MATPGIPAMLTPAEVQAALRVSRTTFYRMVERGDFEVIRLGSREDASIRVSVEELGRFVAGTPSPERILEPTTKEDTP